MASRGKDTQEERPTFLVVDDDPMTRKLVVSGLERLYPERIFEVTDGLEAQRLLKERPVDVVITDVLMPNMDGQELMKWAQEHCPGPLWIVLSGLDTFDAAVEALQAGAFDFLAKPPEIRRVELAVRNALGQIKLQRDRERLYRELERSNALLAEKVDQLEEVCRMLEDQAEVIQSDLARAEVIQRALLPQSPPDTRGWCIESLYRPGSKVGGDFYNVEALGHGSIGVVIADAAGHGVAAAMLTVLFKHRLELCDPTGAPLAPKEVLRLANQRLHADITAPGSFITATYLLIDLQSGHARLASAGHPPGIWANASVGSRFLARTGPALGLQADAPYEETEIDLAHGDRLLLYTDGVLDGGSFSPSREDLARGLGRSDTTRDEILSGFFEAAIRDGPDDRDDITMVLLERSDGASRYDAESSESHPRPSAIAGKVPLTAGGVLVQQGVVGDHGFLLVSGNGTWQQSALFLEAAQRLLESNDVLVIDLEGCEHLDSTFLGTLHELVASKPQSVHLQRVPTTIVALFDELSMQAVLDQISVSAEPTPEDLTPLQGRAADMDAQRMLRAHEVLASLSAENREQFESVVDSLRAEIQDGGGPDESS